MVSISLCMIVKNEEKVLARCLDSVADLVDELVVVDTGSTDATMQIAAGYANVKLYEFAWVDDFSAARNFAFSKATKEYIYSADADEVLDEENRERFRILKETLLDEVEIVQMKYANQLRFGTVYNFDEEYRPKLFKRLRPFVWEEAIHETVRTTPVVFDSDIVITHLPEESHAGRDIAAFERLVKRGERLSKRLHGMYARELVIAGSDEEIRRAGAFFSDAVKDETRDGEEVREALVIAAAAARREGDEAEFFRHATKAVTDESSSEICCELGDFYFEKKDYDEAVIWYYNACYETKPILSAKAGRERPLAMLARCYDELGMPEQADLYREEALVNVC